jgi:hypothetical protein
MNRRIWLTATLVAALWAAPAKADSGIIVRTSLGLQGLQSLCLLNSCTVVGALDGTLNQIFLLTTPLDPQTLVGVLRLLPGIANAELDQVLSVAPLGGLNQLPAPLPAGLLSSRTLSAYPPATATLVWDSYVNQPAAGIIKVPQAQLQFKVTGSGIVADIDTGVDPNHPALQGVLLPGYDFTRNQVGASELNDLNPTDFPTYPPPGCNTATCPAPAKVNQSTAAVLDQSTAAVLDGKVQYAAFGHGTMVMGVIHLVAPTAKLLPLKAFHADGTGSLSDILRAIYFAVQNNANVINMSFDFKTASPELQAALDYANQLQVTCAASAGNDGQGPPPPFLVYPAALQADVMGVASTSNTDARSSFSNFGNSIVWVAAPGEAIVSTYPFSTYSAGWGTSFSSPLVSGASALVRNLGTDSNESLTAAAVAHAQFVGADLGNGRLDLLMALAALAPGNTSPDFKVASAPSGTTVAAGELARFTVTAAPSGGFKQTVTWACSAPPPASTCTISPASETLDGTNVANATVTVTTMTRGFIPPLFPPRSSPRPLGWRVLSVCATWVLILLLAHNWKHSPRTRLFFTASAVLVLATLCSSCGGGTSAVSPPPGTPANTYTITVTGSSGNLNHASTFKLTVK